MININLITTNTQGQTGGKRFLLKCYNYKIINNVDPAGIQTISEKDLKRKFLPKIPTSNCLPLP
jgi:hypothetical protein